MDVLAAQSLMIEILDYRSGADQSLVYEVPLTTFPYEIPILLH
jgi:hypothetical protein